VKRLFDAERAEPLALLRIVVPILVLLAPGLREGPRVAAWDPAMRVVPEGLGFFAAHVPIGPGLARAVEVVTVFAALCAAVGVRARVALVVLTVGAGYLFSIAQLTGFVWHDMHLLWMCALLAASPCDHALAWDRLPPRPPSTAYGVPLAFARALLGAVYFFPGVHKLRQQGLGWALSDNLQHQLFWKWLEHGVQPTFRIDHHPMLLHAGGLFVLAFELLAPVLFFVRRTRSVGAALGVAFHLLAQIVFRIPFASLFACYVVLLDVRVAFPTRPADDEEPARPSRWTYAVGAALLAGAVVQGARGQMQSYPFACYPTFQWDPGALVPDLRFEATLADGRTVDVPHARDARGHRTQRQWGTVFALVGASHPVDDARLRAYFRALERGGAVPPGVVRVRVMRDWISANPDDHARIVREETIDAFSPPAR
jgi:hypothetical protein